MIASASAPGSRKSTGAAGARREDRDRGEEEQHDDRDDDRDQHVLAAPRGQPQLHRASGRAVAAGARAGRLTAAVLADVGGSPTSSR